MTKRQAETLAFIRKFIAENGYSPSVKEIAAGMGLRCGSTAAYHVRELVEQGRLRHARKGYRDLEVVDEQIAA